MSYKHNNLMAMRHSWWDDESTPNVKIEKQFFQQTLTEQGVYDTPSLDDVKYFSLACPALSLLRDTPLVLPIKVLKI